MTQDVPDHPHRLPPGQVLTSRFPIVGEKESNPPHMDPDHWRLEWQGPEHETLAFTYDEILQFPSETLRTDIHCVTGWSRLDTVFQGFRLSRFLEAQGITFSEPRGFLRFLAYSSRGHDTSLPLKRALDEAWCIHSQDGKALSPAHGYPLRLVVPSRYFYKSLKWLKRIEWLAQDQLGFWERTTGYHNEADPWQEQRLEATRFSSRHECEAFRRLDCFDAYRSTTQDPRVIVKADFSGWDPKTRDLSGLHLKSCQFQDARLSGVQFQRANLTFGRFQGANLEGCDFTGADLEGCDFTGALLAGAVFDSNFFSAARFFSPSNRGGDPIGLASWKGMTVRHPDGLLEDQEAYLENLGVLIP